jgi:uncharacterized membrane protein YgdD (TMEM256/DUF423 family)
MTRETKTSPPGRFALFGCVGGGLAVVLGAFGAHALKGSLSAEMLGIFETAVRYQMYHSLALIAVTLLAERSSIGGPLFQAAGWLFVAGIVVFSGSLYLLAATSQTWLGAVTPLGGLAFIAGWGLLGWAVVRKPA